MKLTGTYTHVGQDLAARLLTGSILTLTRIVAGSGTTDPSAAQMDREEQPLGLCAPVLEGRTALLRCTLNSTQADAPYTLTELGVYARDGEEEVLYLLYTLDQPFLVDPAARSVLRFNLEQTLADGASVTIHAPLDGLVTQEELDTKADLVEGQVPYAQTPHLTGNVTLYVDAVAGSDGNPGTQEAPFQTIQAAVKSLPKDLNGVDVTIQLAVGTYQENVIISGFFGGRLHLYGSIEQKESYRVKTALISGCTAVYLSGISAETIAVYSTGYCYISDTVVSDGAENYGISSQDTTLALYRVTVNGYKMALSITSGSILAAGSCTGTGNTIGVIINPNDGFPGFAMLHNCNFSASTEIQKSYGSIVFKDGVQV